MKRHLALLVALSMAATLFCTPPAFASVQETVSFSDGTALYSGNADMTAEVVSLYDGNKAVRFTSTSDELTNNSKCLRYSRTYTAADTAVFSYDFMVEDLQSGNSEGAAIGMAYKINGKSWHWAPRVMADKTFGSAEWETGKWYTVKYYANAEDSTISATLTDKQTGSEVAAYAPAYVNYGDAVKGFWEIELHPLIKGSILIDNLCWASENSKVVITYPIVGSPVNFDDPLKVSASIPLGAASAVLKINGKEVDTLENIEENENITFADADLGEVGSYGEIDIEVEAIYADKTLSAANTYKVNAFDNTRIFAGVPSPGDWTVATDYVAGSAFVDAANYDTAYDEAHTYLKATALKETTASMRAPNIAYRQSVNGGIVEVGFKMTLEQPAGISKITIDNKNAAGSWVTFNSIMENGKFYGESELAKENTEYAVKAIYDTDNKTVTVTLDGKELFTAINKADDYSLTYVETTTNKAGTSITISDVTIDRITVINDMTGLSYTIGTEEVEESDWENAEVKPTADSINLSFSGDISSTTANSLAELYKIENGEMTFVNTTEEIVGNKLVVIPSDGFEANSEYRIQIFDAKIGNHEYNAPIVYGFKTGSYKFEVLSPKDGESFCDSDIKVQIISPDAEPTVELGGSKYAAERVKDSVYTVTIPFDDINLGKHKLTVSSGSDSRTINVETYSFLGELKTVDDLYKQISGSVEKCDGSDGMANGALKINAKSFIQLVAWATAADKSWTLDLNINRLTNDANFDLESYNSNSSVGSKYTYLGGNPLINSDGTLFGTSTKLVAGRWYNIRVTQELGVNGAYEIYLDGALAASGNSPYDFSALDRTKLQANAGSVAVEKVYYGTTDEYVHSPRFSALSYDTGDGEVQAADGVTVSAAAKTITITMTEAFDEILEGDVVITAADGTTIDASVAQDGNKVIITPVSSMPKDKDITVTFGTELFVGGYSLNKPIDVQLYSKDESDKINEFYIAKDTSNGKVKAHLSIEKGRISTLPGELTIYIAAYSDGGMLNEVKLSTFEVQSGVNTVESETLTAVDGVSYKAFLWDGQMQPYASTNDVK